MATKTITFDQLPEVKRFYTDVVKQSERVLTAGANQFLADLKTRVFTKGEGADERLIGGYSDAWKRVRRSRGRQTNYVDLKFSSDLSSSIDLGVRDSRTIDVGITNARNAEKARDNEERFRDDEDTIFIANEDEAKRAAKKMDIAVKNILNGI